MSDKIQITDDKTTLKFIVDIIDADLKWFEFFRDNYTDGDLDASIKLRNRIDHLKIIRDEIWGAL